MNLGLVRLGLPLAALLASSCTFQPGGAFGSVESATFTARFAPPASRLDDAGQIKTDTGYRVRVDALAVTADDLDFQYTSGTGATGATFDPSKPPPGYLICHNGHCDREDGALVPYDEVAAELSGGTLKTLSALLLPIDRRFDVASGVGQATLTTGTPLARNTWTRAVLKLRTLEATGSVTDGTSKNRLGGQAREWSLTVSPEAFNRKIEVPIDRSNSGKLGLAATFTLTEKLWDQIDWQAIAPSTGSITLDSSASVRMQLLENVAQSQLDIQITR
jgi:hypothetical protein